MTGLMATRGAWRSTRAAAALLGLALLAACQTVPVTGRQQFLLLSEEEEARLGGEAFQELLRKSKVSTDPALNELVTRVGRCIAEATGRSQHPHYGWEYKVLEDKQANAFAMPGGKIVVYTGMLPVTQDEAGLAAVLAHEVSHVIARHVGERVSQQLVVQGLAGAVLGGVLGGDPEVSQAVSAIFAQAVLLPWNRNQESEADRLGLTYMAKAGYDPRAARELWVRMAQARQGAQLPEFLSTHPADETRIRQIEAWLPEALPHYQPGRRACPEGQSTR
jgi:predicted Zn-dependent protease